jgi:hypothetical protein
MNYSRQDVRICTKITDPETLAKMAVPVVDFAHKHDVFFDLGWDANNCLVATYEAEGKTSAYCKGMVAEIKQMLKDIYKCKIDVMLYAY